MKLKYYIDIFRIIQRASRHERGKLFALLRTYRMLDQEIERFKAVTGLRCASGCGRCCENPKVETTVLELLPLAIELWRQGEAGSWLEKIDAVDAKGPCIFYQPDRLVPGKGRCSVYSLRPLICRLYGFSAVTDKHGDYKLLTCPVIKNIYPQEYGKAGEKITAGMAVPKMASFSMKILNIDSSLGTVQLSINEAAKLAIERIGFILSFKK